MRPPLRLGFITLRKWPSRRRRTRRPELSMRLSARPAIARASTRVRIACLSRPSGLRCVRAMCGCRGFRLRDSWSSPSEVRPSPGPFGPASPRGGEAASRVNVPKLCGHTRDWNAPVAKAGGAGRPYTEQIGRSGNEVADGDRTGIGEQTGVLPIARSVIGADWCKLDVKDPYVGNRAELENQLRAFAVIDANDHRL